MDPNSLVVQSVTSYERSRISMKNKMHPLLNVVTYTNNACLFETSNSTYSRLKNMHHIPNANYSGMIKTLCR